MPPSPPAAVVFDCDGVLLDTESAWTRAETALFARYGRAFGIEDKRAMIGTSLQESAAILERLLDQPHRGPALLDELIRLAEVEFARGVGPLPGAVDLVETLRGARPIAVASNTHRDLVELSLRTAGFADAFDAIVAGDEVVYPKPAPDIYLRACGLLGARPTESVAVEDTVTGIRAARAAGMFVIGIPSLEGTVLEADLVAASLEDPEVRRAVGVGVTSGS